MSKIKKVVAVISSIMLTSGVCVCVYGNGQAEPSISNTITVSQDGMVQIDIPETENKFGKIVYVFEPGTDLSGGLSAENLNKAIKMELVSGNSFSFMLDSNAPYGIYKVVFSEEGVNNIALFSYTEPGIEAAAVEALKMANEQNISGILEQYNNYAYLIDIPADESKKEEVSKIMFNVIRENEISSSYDIELNYNTSLAIYELRTSDALETENILRRNVQDWGWDILSNTDYTDYISENSERFASLRNGTSLVSLEDVRGTLDVAIALTGFDNALRSEKISKLQEYNHIFNLDFSGKFTNANMVTLNRELDGHSVETVEDVKKLFSAAVDKSVAVKDPVVYPGGGSSAGGGGGAGIIGGINNSFDIETTDDNVIDADTIEELVGKDSIKFLDISDFEWAKKEIEYLAYNNIMTGDGNGMFRPNEAITREEFVKILVSAFSLKAQNKEVSFLDVNHDAWYYESLAIATNKNIINGITEEYFGVGEEITRQDAAVILYRLIENEGYVLTYMRENIQFDDNNNISQYALFAVDSLYRAGIVNGVDNNKFMPNGFMNRAEAAKMLYGALEHLLLIK
ncbi:S-layer homology domain-containing protein [Ructibacterium gallinarum]|uniref:S-layer homology domain-containing protein n=1 Tax=Ructibacterium gallinarum TaxID=2779355 RepID=A0A9D5M1G7_9FIRM|nr:S-layer homology domain-containing protein [Ructibacterium gallinarum]MBE5040882.1 S-layer homology domain-containing protein [Ructibacterium gallinarum]